MAVVIWLGRRCHEEVRFEHSNVSSFVDALQRELIGNKWNGIGANRTHKSGSASGFFIVINTNKTKHCCVCST